MIPVPRGRLIGLFSIPLGFYIASYWSSYLFSFAVFINVLLLIIFALDLLATLPHLKFEVTADKKKLFSIGRTNTLTLTLANLSPETHTFALKLNLPKGLEDKTEHNFIELKGQAAQRLDFLIRPVRRGSFFIDFLELRVFSKYKFLFFDVKSKLELTLDVYPDIKQLNYFLKLTKNNRDYELGINRSCWMGMGTDLESLREYRQDDDSRFIDWKASTRVNRPLTKVFQMEMNNHITIALDCGRLMTAEQKGLSTLDHAINSLLILAHIAAKAGDTISVVAFSDKIIGKIPHLKGRSSLTRITEFITKLKPEFVESNYALMFDFLEKSQKKRSLIIILTDMIDDINYELFKKRIFWLSRRHSVLFILMQDTLLSYHAHQPVKNSENLYVNTASREMFLQRHRAISRLKHYKINVLDVLPHELTGPMINKYLELKSKNRL